MLHHESLETMTSQKIVQRFFTLWPKRVNHRVPPFSTLLMVVLQLAFIHKYSFSQENAVPYHVSPNVFDFSRPADEGLSVPSGTKTITIFRPSENTPKYSLGVVLMPFHGYLYAQWQTSENDEDAPDTHAVFSRSQNGVEWTAPTMLVPSYVHGVMQRMHTSGGWWTDGTTLVAYINVWNHDTTQPKGGFTEYITSNDGEHWSMPKPLCDHLGKPIRGIIEQDMHALPDGRILTAFHEQPGLIVSPYYTDDPRGINGWTKGAMQNLPHEGSTSRELEPSWFYQSTGTVVMVFRDQNSTFRQWASVSNDQGKTWTTPVKTDMPDSRAKQSAGNFPDSTAFLVNCPSGNKDRFPLAVTVSKNGMNFEKAFVLRKGGPGLQPLRYKGIFKRTGYHYPKSLVWYGYLYVSYATNKEDVEITRVPLSSLK